jgi:aminomethyltransferase
MVCNPAGGIKDDIFIYHTKPDEYLVCVNASNRTKIVQWWTEQRRPSDAARIDDESDVLSQLALQGAESAAILTRCGLTDAAALKPRTALPATLHGATALVSRTGYTGEPGWELYVPSSIVGRVWDDLMHAGAGRLKPAGLGSRDLLRLEMAYLLYGNDITEETTPLEASAAWVVDFAKGEFIGREALDRQRAAGPARKLVGFELVEKAVPRHGFPIALNGGEPRAIGEVTSGNLSPLLQKGIGLGYVASTHASVGTRLAVDIRGKLVPALVVQPPFYRRPKRDA